MVSRYERLCEWLGSCSDEIVTVALGEVDRILGRPLPDSARRYPAFWSTGHYVGQLIAERGWRASLRVRDGTVVFRRSAHLGGAVRQVEQHGPESESDHPAPLPDLILVGCVKEKLLGRHPARELYTSALFAGRRRRAESTGCPWFVLSAKHGLVGPDEPIETYDVELSTQAAAVRRQWSDNVLAAIRRRFGEVRGKHIEFHAGAAYRDNGLVQGLRSQGAHVLVPLEGLTFGEQLAHYADTNQAAPAPREVTAIPMMRPAEARPSRDFGDIVAAITGAFLSGALDLSKRAGAPPPGWDALPECAAAAELRGRGANDSGVRVFLTLVAALDRAREANQLWEAATQLFCRSPWVFNPQAVVGRTLTALRDELAFFGVSRRHGPDAAAWRLICEALTSLEAPAPVIGAIRDGKGEATQLMEALQQTTRGGQAWFPFLSGPKVSVMWIRMLAHPGSAQIDNLQVVPVAVDVQVRKVTEYLGMAATRDQSLETARAVIQTAWAAQASKAAGPPALKGTAAAIDPAVWFFGKWGCTHCEQIGRQAPISDVCSACSFRRS
jgi:hypothetical protein